MRAKWATWGLLLGLVTLGTGASAEGVQQARFWLRAGDIARSGGQWHVAYQYYNQAAETFPDTQHGKLANRRAYRMQRYLLAPDRAPFKEDPGSHIEEFLDFLIWP